MLRLWILGAQIDRAQPLAVAAHLFEIFLDLGERRQFHAWFDFGKAGDRLRLDFEHVMDFALDVGEAALGAFHALFGTGAGFAGAGERLERNFCGAVGFRHQCFGGGKRVRGGAAVILGVLDFANQRAALFREYRRGIFKLRTLGGDFGDAGLDGRDLRRGALLAVLPFAALAEDRLHAAVGKFSLARQRLRLGTHLCCEPAMALDLAADGGKFGFGLEARRQVGQRSGGGLMGGLGLGAIGGEAAARFGQRRAARGVAVDLAFGRSMALARGIGVALCGAPGFARGGLSG